MSTLNVNNINEAGGVDAVITAGVLDSGSLPAGSILQVVSTTKTDGFSTTSTSYVDVTDMSVSITPSSVSNKILVLVNASLSNSQTTGAQTRIRLLRDATPVSVTSSGDSAAMVTVDTGGNRELIEQSVTYLDSPSSTSALTYKIQMKVGSDTGFLNRAGNTSATKAVSSITVMEVAG